MKAKLKFKIEQIEQQISETSFIEGKLELIQKRAILNEELRQIDRGEELDKSAKEICDIIAKNLTRC